MGRAAVLVLGTLLGLALTGCGEETPQNPVAAPSTQSPEPSQTPTTELPDGPDCAAVWVADGDLPGSYEGCLDGDSWVAADATRCESGQVLVVYGDRYYGAKGARVNDVGAPLDSSDQYQKAKRACG